MDHKQREAAYRLLAAIEANEITKEDAVVHGNWYFYLLEHLQADEQDYAERILTRNLYYGLLSGSAMTVVRIAFSPA